MNDKLISDSHYEHFLKLFRQNEKMIWVRILAAVPNRTTAEDIMQETTIVMWRKFSDFEAGSSFSAWGIKIARFLILDYFRKNQNTIVCFDSHALENIMDSDRCFDDIDDRREALRICVKRLPDNLQQLIRLRYVKSFTIKDVASKVGQPVHGMYKRIARIHFLLQGCIEKTLVAWKVR